MRMKSAFVLLTLLFAPLCSAPASAFKFSGTLDTSMYLGAGAGEAPAFIAGVEEFANIRAQARIGDSAVFYGALNLIAMSGSYAKDFQLLHMARKTEPGFQPSVYAAAENYASGIELERLYFALNSDRFGFNAGLKRLAFGYGSVFGPTDFLNPKNPLLPDARPRATLGGDLAFFPDDDSKLLAFAAAPRFPVDASGCGTLAGVSAERHWEKISLQGLYVYESPTDAARQGVHRFGLSAKADLELGFAFDALYTFDGERAAQSGFNGNEGLSASLGADYSLADGKLYLLTEYLYSGKRSSTSIYGGNLSGFSNEHYLYTTARWSFDDYTNVSLGCLAGFSDYSFVPIAGFHYDIVQGLALDVTAQAPLDRDTFAGTGDRGELGPIPPGANQGRRFTLTSRLRLRL